MTVSPTSFTYNIDPVASSVRFAIRHFMIAWSRGEFSEVNGTVTWNEAVPTETRVTAVINSDSITTGHAQRDEHVKSPDILDTAKYPVIKFASTSAHMGLNDNILVEGDLTFHGITKRVELTVHETSSEVKDPWGNLRVGATATGTIKRSDFGVHFNSTLENGGLVLSDDVELTLDLQLIRKAE